MKFKSLSGQVRTNMETSFHVNNYEKFHKLRKWRNKKNWLENWFIWNLMSSDSEQPNSLLLFYF